MKRGSQKFEPLPPEPPDPNSGNNGVILYCTTVQHETVMVENFSRYESSQSNCQSFIHQQCCLAGLLCKAAILLMFFLARCFWAAVHQSFMLYSSYVCM